MHISLYMYLWHPDKCAYLHKYHSPSNGPVPLWSQAPLTTSATPGYTCIYIFVWIDSSMKYTYLPPPGIYTFVYVYRWIYQYTCLPPVGTYTCICGNQSAYECNHAYIHTNLHIHVHIRTCIQTCRYSVVYTFLVFVCVCLCVFVQTYLCKYALCV